MKICVLFSRESLLYWLFIALLVISLIMVSFPFQVIPSEVLAQSDNMTSDTLPLSDNDTPDLLPLDDELMPVSPSVRKVSVQVNLD